MTVVHLAAGAAGMYCGACMHDNRLAAALRDQGRDVVLLPLYTPLRTDEIDVSRQRVYYGGVNVYLQQTSALFRHTPWFLDRIFDARRLLNVVGRFAGSTSPEALGAMTLSVLQGPDGSQRKELDKLVAGLRGYKPDLLHLPNLMFVGLAATLKAALGVPVLCGLAGEDIFLDQLPPAAYRSVFDLIRARAVDVDGFTAPTDYYARHATTHFGLPPERVHRIPLGIRTTDFNTAAEPPEHPFTIGYLAHVFSPKGLADLCDAFIALRRAGHDCRLRVAGYVGPADRDFVAEICARMTAAGCTPDEFDFIGEVSRAEKLRFLRSLHVLSVPTQHPESKGFYVLEALASGVPVVQPAHGSFPELIEATGGGLLYEPGDTSAFTDTLRGLITDAPLRRRLATQGHAAVHANHTAENMATAAWRLYESFM